MPVFRLVTLILLVAGAPFVLLGAYEAVQTQGLLSRWSRAGGTIVDNSYATTQDGTTVSGAYYPVVEFTTADGEVVRFTDGVGSLPPDYAVDAHVPVIYDPADPHAARLASWKRLWFTPTLFVVIGLLPTLVFQLWRVWAALNQRRGQAACPAAPSARMLG
jgi:hypothetical protein